MLVLGMNSRPSTEDTEDIGNVIRKHKKDRSGKQQTRVTT